MPEKIFFSEGNNSGNDRKKQKDYSNPFLLVPAG